ncbi:DUF1996 domain-containing protein [Amycolatopsis sp. NPDC059021]|uniref:DUF1996 domain-containing protein n=1 Tax=Amycolatopsis sp. NPDC059021 TaxID=3346704 RepID=UPI0036721580
MAQRNGRHRVSRRAKFVTAAIALPALVGATLVTVTTVGKPGDASADAVDGSFFVDITKVRPNVNGPNQQESASRGTFTVDCGKNENGHFNPDNFIAQPGVKNGAQHLHDYVGNLSTNADSSNKSLLKAGTTCRNGDKSAYFWPVVRIDREDGGKNPPAGEKKRQRRDQQTRDGQDKAAPRIDCPDVGSALPDEIPDQAQQEIAGNLDDLDQRTDEANQRLEAARGQGGPEFVRTTILEPLAAHRKAVIDRMAGAAGGQPQDLGRLAPCALKDRDNRQGLGDGADNSDTAQAEGAGTSSGQALGEENDNLELDGNDGEIQRPATVALTFRGSPAGRVTAMPRFLRVLYGDAKVTTNGPKNARDSWTCTGFENRVLIGKYPICPRGSRVERIHDFPSCWDGKRIDSANHRDHIVFPGRDGRCKRGFKAVPQLRVTLTYDIPPDVQRNRQYKVDSFPEEKHNPASDHDDFANVMSQSIMNRVVACINKGRTCRE